MTELLAPVGNWTMLETAIKAGADAVYLGITGSNMRVAAQNFCVEDLPKIVARAQEDNVRVYLTVNTVVYDEEIEQIKKVLRAAKKAEVDAIICWDLAVLHLAKEMELEIHLSTQASVSNFQALKTYAEMGVKRFVLARELSLEQIKEIIEKVRKNKLNVGIETFIHGAMCVSVSGRCFLSQFTFDKSANKGECWQPCRRKYLIKDVDKEIEFRVGENFIMSPKDLCTIMFVEKLIDAGVDCLKIEGRNRSAEYVKTVVSCYREVIDAHWNFKNEIEDTEDHNPSFENDRKQV